MAHKRLFLDTNIFIYFFEKHPSFFHKVSYIFEQAQRNEIELLTSVLSYMEVLLPVVGLKNLSLEVKYNYVFKKIATTIDINMEISKLAAKLKSQYNLKTPDAIQLGCALYSKCDSFVTADKHFKLVSEVDVQIIN